MKVIKATGLVPVRGLVRTQFAPGTIFGLSPERAIEGVKTKEVELVPIGSGVETIDVDGPETAEAPAVEESAKDGVIEIPANWDKPQRDGGLQWMQVVVLAQDILGTKLDPVDGKKPVEVAAEVIRNEIERRAAASTPPQTAAAA